MKSKGGVLQETFKKCKDVDAPETILCDAAREKTSKYLIKFYRYIGTTFRFLEEGTPCEESFIKDMK